MTIEPILLLATLLGGALVFGLGVFIGRMMTRPPSDTSLRETFRALSDEALKSNNEAFLTLWLIDTLLWWRHLSWSKQRVPYWIVQAIFAFLMFQATVVFGPRFWIPIFVLVTAFLGRTSLMRRSSVKTSVL